MTARLTATEALALPCYNQPHQWADSDSPKDREHAVRKCASGCAQLDWCEQQRLDTVRDHGSAVGVWAGKVWTHSDYRSDGAGRRVA